MPMKFVNLQSAPITFSNASAKGTGHITSYKESDDSFCVQMDLSQFKPEDLKVCKTNFLENPKQLITIMNGFDHSTLIIAFVVVSTLTPSSNTLSLRNKIFNFFYFLLSTARH